MASGCDMPTRAKGLIDMAYRKTPAIKAHLKEQRAAILDSALAVAKHGRDGMLTRITKHAGVSMGFMYRYFADIDELWHAAVARRLARDVELIAVAAGAERYPLNALARAIEAYYGTITDVRLARVLDESAPYRRGIRNALEPLIHQAIGSPPRARTEVAAGVLAALYGLADVEASTKAATRFALRAIGLSEAMAERMANV